MFVLRLHTTRRSRGGQLNCERREYTVFELRAPWVRSHMYSWCSSNSEQSFSGEKFAGSNFFRTGKASGKHRNASTGPWIAYWGGRRGFPCGWDLWWDGKYPPQHARVWEIRVSDHEEIFQMGSTLWIHWLWFRQAYSKAIELWNKRSEPQSETSRTYFKLSRVLDKLGHVEKVADMRMKAHQILDQIGPNLTENDINDLLPAWARRASSLA